MKEIPLRSKKYPGHVALIDDEDYERVFAHRWTVESGGTVLYAVLAEKWGDKWATVRLHRFILGLTKDDPNVDHRNGNGLDNQKHNLRFCNKAQNAGNQRIRQTSKSSQYKGVYFETESSKWVAGLGVEWLGRFCSEESAAQAYDRAAKRVFGEFARLNFPTSQS